MPKPVRRKNPGEDIFPQMDPASPIRPLIDVETKITGTVVVLPVPGKRQFVATTLEDPRISVSAATRQGAQKAAMDAYIQKSRLNKSVNPGAPGEDDLRALKIANRRMRERGGSSVEALAKKYGVRI